MIAPPPDTGSSPDIIYKTSTFAGWLSEASVKVGEVAVKSEVVELTDAFG